MVALLPVALLIGAGVLLDVGYEWGALGCMLAFGWVLWVLHHAGKEEANDEGVDG